MAVTYEPIATTTLGTAQSTITFSSIPSTYTDLRLVFTGTTTTGNVNLQIVFNGETGTASTNYSQTNLRGNGTAAASGRTTSTWNWISTWATGLDATIPTMTTMDVFSYAGSTFKTGLITLSADLNGSGSTEAFVSLYRNTSAITQITLSPAGTTFKIGTTATLYGIKAA